MARKPPPPRPGTDRFVEDGVGIKIIRPGEKTQVRKPTRKS